MTRSDVVIVGGGIVGLATAVALLDRRPRLGVTVLEKETAVCAHQSGHNSGVIHSGLYYRPGSLRAKLSIEGARLTRQLCEAHDLPLKNPGKVVVATAEHQRGALAHLQDRAERNGVPVERVDATRLSELQPGLAGVEALWVPQVCITDFAAVGRHLARVVTDAGGEVRTGVHFSGAERVAGGWELRTSVGRVATTSLVTCAGLHADRVARSSGAACPVGIVPFRGEFLALSPHLAATIERLVYPVPDPAVPFLGVHLTPRLDGTVDAGPNAVLALSREGYAGGVNARDAWDLLRFPGTWRLLASHARLGAREQWRSWSLRSFARALRVLLPTVQPSDLARSGTGVRAIAVGRDGAMLDDFEVIEHDGAFHVLNAPSPAATAALPIGRWVADRVVSSHPV